MSETTRESMEVDVLIVGGGPAGLATACRLMQLSTAHNHPVSVVVLEKGAEIGAHTLSGAVIEPRALDELFPDWRDAEGPEVTPVTKDEVLFYTSENKALRVPNAFIPRTMHNDGNYVASLGNVVRWLGQQAESLGVEIYPGFPASEVLFHEDGSVKGVATPDMGLNAEGERKPTFEPGMELHARVTVFAEGCRGQLGKVLINHFELDRDAMPQHYGIGLKEVWEIPENQHEPGKVVHGAGWPLSQNGASGGSFLYHMNNNLVSLGLIVDLNYTNPYLSPFDELQRYKTHASVRSVLAGGRRIGYGARAITKGGLSSLPRMTMPGAMLVGCDAGTLNFSKIKGTHTAMKSGMVAAESIFDAIRSDTAAGAELSDFNHRFESSWAYDELHRARNFGAALHKLGVYGGGAFNYLDQNWFKGKLPFTLKDRSRDHDALEPLSQSREPDYPKPDGELTFDKNSSVYLTNTYHEEDQPVHLRLTDAAIPLSVNLPNWGEPAQRYCPAGVYEVLESDDGKRFQINAQNCIHCKTCDIKDPSQNITWVAPEGGGGPNYTMM